MAKLGNITYGVEPPKKPRGMKKDKIALGGLSLMVRLHDI